MRLVREIKGETKEGRVGVSNWDCVSQTHSADYARMTHRLTRTTAESGPSVRWLYAY